MVLQPLFYGTPLIGPKKAQAAGDNWVFTGTDKNTLVHTDSAGKKHEWKREQTGNYQMESPWKNRNLIPVHVYAPTNINDKIAGTSPPFPHNSANKQYTTLIYYPGDSQHSESILLSGVVMDFVKPGIFSFTKPRGAKAVIWDVPGSGKVNGTILNRSTYFLVRNADSRDSAYAQSITNMKITPVGSGLQKSLGVQITINECSKESTAEKVMPGKDLPASIYNLLYGLGYPEVKDTKKLTEDMLPKSVAESMYGQFWGKGEVHTTNGTPSYNDFFAISTDWSLQRASYLSDAGEDEGLLLARVAGVALSGVVVLATAGTLPALYTAQLTGRALALGKATGLARVVGVTKAYTKAGAITSLAGGMIFGGLIAEGIGLYNQLAGNEQKIDPSVSKSAYDSYIGYLKDKQYFLYKKADIAQMVARYYLETHLALHQCVLDKAKVAGIPDNELKAAGFDQATLDDEVKTMDLLAKENDLNNADTLDDQKEVQGGESDCPIRNNASTDAKLTQPSTWVPALFSKTAGFLAGPICGMMELMIVAAANIAEWAIRGWLVPALGLQ